MWTFLKFIFAAIGSATFLVATVITLFLWKGGFFKTLEPKFAGDCRVISGEASAEDIIIDEAAGLAYLSAFDRLGARGRPGLLGAIATYNLAGGAGHFDMGHKDPPPGFQPHGMSLFHGASGMKRLFVISRIKQNEDVIELFDAGADGALTHFETLEGALLTSPNALAAVGPHQFYVANDNRKAGRGVQFLDNVFGFGSSDLVYYDGSVFRSVAQVPYGSGIASSRDGHQIYYAATSKKKIMVFDRDADTGALTHVRDVPLGSAVDNVRVAQDGALWVAGHVKLLALISHFTSGGKENSPTQIFRIPMDGGVPGEPEEIYLNMGDEISAGSVASPYSGGFLVGSITEKKFLICQPD